MSRRASQTKAPKWQQAIAQGNTAASSPEVASSPERIDLGESPEGWRQLRVAELGSVVTGKTPSTGKREFWDGDIPFFTPVDLNDGLICRAERTISEQGLSLVKELPRWSVAVSCIGQIGKVGLIDCERSATNQQINAVVPLPTHDALFLAYRFQLLRPQLQAAASMTTVPILNKSNFEDVQLSVPALPEQRAIAEVLRTVQRAREATEKVIAATRQLKASLLKHLFTYGPVPLDQADRVHLKESAVGPIPESWPVVGLGLVSELFQYGTSRRCDARSPGRPVLRIPNIIGGMVDVSELKYLAPERDEAESYHLAPGDLLFVRTNGQRRYVGRCAVYQGEPREALFASYLIRVRVKAEVTLPEFVQLYSETESGRGYLSGRASGAADGKFNINTQTLRSVQLPCPTLDVQRQIAEMVDTISQSERAKRLRLFSLEALFSSALHHLMTGKVRLPEFAGSRA